MLPRNGIAGIVQAEAGNLDIRSDEGNQRFLREGFCLRAGIDDSIRRLDGEIKAVDDVSSSLEDGEILAVRMNDGEPVQNVPRSMKEEGHKVLKLVDNEDGTYTMYVRKVEE